MRAVHADHLAEAMTWEQVCARYPDQWVVLVDVDWVDDTWMEFRSAVVVGHGPHPDDPLAAGDSVRDRYPDQAHLYTGEPNRLPALA